MLRSAVWQGRCTGRPDSQVPGAVLARLTGSRLRGNLVMHFGQGALAGVVRALMANAGLRGPVASAMFTVVRLSNDQILENATGVGAPPQTWPRRELVVDLLHGLRRRRARRPAGAWSGQRHAALRPGRQPDVGPAGGE
nr:hypothetical protein [Amycolatopsis sacchari]